MTSHSHTIDSAPIAVIGLAGFFARSGSIEDYWRLIYQGEDGITEVPDTHWHAGDYYHEDPKTPDHVYCVRGGFIAPVAFDPTEFGIPPANLQATDTSQLLGLLAAKSALQDAGYEGEASFDHDRASVILGVTGTQELVIPLGARLGHPIWRRALSDAGISNEKADEVVSRIANAYVGWQENSFPGLLGNVVAGRIANRLHLGGTNCVVDAACASSMSAVNLAMLELASGRSDMVLTGGVDTLNDIFMHMCFAKTMILSPSGDARPFSASADGTVLGEGVGIVVMKRLADAERDGDRIYAVVRGLGASSDGKAQSIYAPLADGQAKALRRAYAQSGVDPSTVRLVEAHGTGTRVGDAVEFSALRDVYESHGATGNRCAIGSVKSMIGHTKAAAGAAGLIKTVLALHHKVLPPTLKVDTPDPRLDVASSPFHINLAARPWLPEAGHPRRAAVSAFGFGGSNFHMVLEEHGPEKTTVVWAGAPMLAAFSGDTPEAVSAALDAFADAARAPGADLRGLCQDTRCTSHREAPHRLVLVLENADALESRLADAGTLLAGGRKGTGVFYGSGATSPGSLAFLFPGQGSQYPDMGRDLVCRFPEALAAVTAFHERLGGDLDLGGRIFPIRMTDGADEAARDERLRRTDVAQPAIGAVSLAMLMVLARFGVTPGAAAGHSFGEITALHAAGAIDRDAFIHLARERGRCMAAAGNGADGAGTMLAIKAPLDTIDDLVRTSATDLVLANRNSPDQGVVSGSVADIARFEAQCRKAGLRTVRLPVAAAFHSPLVAPAFTPLLEVLSDLDLTPPALPVYANLTGGPYPADSDACRDTLGRQLVSPVRFDDQVRRMYDDGCTTFVEVGPRRVLTGLVARILADRPHKALAADAGSGRRPAVTDLANLLAELAADGHAVDLSQWDPAPCVLRQPKMTVPISGANVRPTAPAVPPADRLQQKALPDEASAVKTDENRTTAVTKENITTMTPSGSTPTPKPQPQQNRTRSATGAITAVQEGIRALQSLQVATAEAHQKFLDTQAEAGRALQRMMAGIQQIADPSPAGYHRDAAPPAAFAATAVPAPHPAAAAHAPAAEPEPVPAPPSPQTPSPVGDTLLDVVATLTGYPVATLSLDMDMEGDLGIDSIKRVEILSNMEERLPHLPSVVPEEMAHLKTLGDIVGYLDTGVSATAPPPAPSVAPSSPSAPINDASPSANGEGIADALVAVVSTLTGYPPEMLSMDMHMETDLGIDSIKRVEILSEMESRLPELPAVHPEEMASLGTLGEIVGYLSGGDAAPRIIDAPAAPAAAPPANASATADALIDIIAELTGYPSETLGPEMDLETDLGIDSIKRVEILSTVEARLPELPSVTPEEMAGLRTIGEIAAHLNGGGGAATVSSAAPAPPSPGPAETPMTPDEPVARHELQAVVTPFEPGPSVTLPQHTAVWIVHEPTPFVEALADAFGHHGAATVAVPLAAIEEGSFPTNDTPSAAGLILVAADGRPGGDTAGAVTSLTTAFRAVQAAAGDLTAPPAGVRFLASVTRLDGRFGLSGRRLSAPVSGALAGLVKTARMEWPDTRCTAFDVCPDMPADDAAARLVQEMLQPDPALPPEIGLDPDTRWTLTTMPAPCADLPQTAPVGGEVVVVTGGARGITAATCVAMARAHRPAFVLIGRSPAPEPEPQWLNGVSDPGAIKKAILDEAFSGSASPKDIESAYRAHMANREVAATLSALADAGARVLYRSADVRSRDALAPILEEARGIGPIKAIIHGAGVLEDCHIVDKTVDQVRRVLETKITGFQHLVDLTVDDPLRTIVVYSSVAARFGNTGQADYAMANEALNKMARKAAQQHPGCRMAAINWGPWEGGMVTPALQRAFIQRGIGLIPMAAGASCMVAEMAADGDAGGEIIYGAAITAAEQPDRGGETSPGRSLSAIASQMVDVQSHRVLNAHVLGGKPVVPFALITEWLGHSALHHNPGLSLAALEDVRLFHGIKIDHGPKKIRLMAGKIRKCEDAYCVDVEIRNGRSERGTNLIHASARAVLTDYFPAPPPLPEDPTGAIPSETIDMPDIYRRLLFHGEALQGIQEISGVSEAGMVARLMAAPKPAEWIAEPIRSRWIGDPLVMDAAFQMAIIWCRRYRDRPCLPSYIGEYQQYRPQFPPHGVTAVMTVGAVTRHRFKAGFVFYDDRDNQLVARVDGFEATMDAGLVTAFKASDAA